MKTAALTTQTLAAENYEHLKAAVDLLGARFTAKMESRDGARAVKLEDCRVIFDPDAQMMSEEQRDTFDVDAHWDQVLRLCRQSGFEVTLSSSAPAW